LAHKFLPTQQQPPSTLLSAAMIFTACAAGAMCKEKHGTPIPMKFNGAEARHKCLNCRKAIHGAGQWGTVDWIGGA